jgi:hypothetical protein
MVSKAIHKCFSQGLCGFLLAHWMMVFYLLAVTSADLPFGEHQPVKLKQYDWEQLHSEVVLQAEAAQDDSEDEDDRFAVFSVGLAEAYASTFAVLRCSSYGEGFLVFRTDPPIYLLVENFRC